MTGFWPWWTSMIYYLLVFSMVIPFQMVMFPTVKLADSLGLANPVGMMVLYLGFGAGLSVFIFSGFVKSIPLEIEEAAYIDGCSPLTTYFQVVWPILKPVTITVAILNGGLVCGSLPAETVRALYGPDPDLLVASSFNERGGRAEPQPET